MILLFLAILMGCEYENIHSVPPVTRTNLQGGSTVATDKSGTAMFTVTAKGVGLYHYDFMEETKTKTSKKIGSLNKADTGSGEKSHALLIPEAAGEGKLVSEVIAVGDSIDFTDPEKVALLTGNNSKAWFLAASQRGRSGLSQARESIVGGNEPLKTMYTDLVWSDEFDVDGVPNPANWTYDLGGGGWGNGEAQIYTDDSDNVIVEDGVLKITAKAAADVETVGAIHYYDHVTLVSTTGVINNIEDFEGTTPSFTPFGGVLTEVVDNPDASGDNISTQVVKSIKPLGAETWGGSFFDLEEPLDLTVYSTVTVKTWSPAQGAVVRLKLENKSNVEEFVEVDANTTVSEGWETLTFDLTTAPAFTYDRVVLFFDFGVSPTGAAAYTSARIKSENRYQFTYGRVEVRAKLPSAGGTWPALWALGANFDEVGWPACGEIDVMEHVGNDPNKPSSALHYPESFGGTAVTASTSTATATTEFHNYTAEWTPDSVKFWVDDEDVHLSFVNTTDTPFNSDFFFIINVAVGGALGGAIDPTFVEDSMEVDYIRVYQ